MWRQSRSGAWAGRGFHYQHTVSVLVLVRQWAGLAPPGYLVPEGFEDCVIELENQRIWVQIKSRKEAVFRDAEVRGFLDAVARKASRLPNGPTIRSVVILEQHCNEKVTSDVADLFDDRAGCVFSCEEPGDQIIRLLSTHLGTAEAVAAGLASELYKLVADASAQNASLSFVERRRISTTEVERRIVERLEAEDPSAIDQALTCGALEPVDFTTLVTEADFYRGVKVKPGHVAAGLVMDRPRDTEKVLEALRQRRHVLVAGPSGAGKSALVWLATAAAAGRKRWYQITGLASAADAEAILRFVRARRPTETSPVGLVFDEVDSTNSSLWDVLVRELRGVPSVYFLGSVRQEDVNLIVNQSDTAFIRIVLDEGLAKQVWQELFASSLTSWSHWREPFEQSDGLMLEYVHLLTEGKRLTAVIGEQIRRREQENRHDELAIIRSAAVLCAYGGEVVASRLFESLRLAPDAAQGALKRLIDEHLVREDSPGILGGLHRLRSEALVRASHDGSVFLSEASLWTSLRATTSETLPRVVQSILGRPVDEAASPLLRNLADTLCSSTDVDQWVAILTGLGLGTIERHVASFVSILDRRGVKRTHWSLASSAADPGLELPDLGGSEQWKQLRGAILDFRKLRKHDLRTDCLALLPAGVRPPCSVGVVQTNDLLSSLVPICGGEPIRAELRYELGTTDGNDVRQLAKLLSTAYCVDPDLAQSLVQTLGGESVLFDLFQSQVPWTTPPRIEQGSEHGRTVRSDWYHVAEKHQQDPHEAICEVCETLMALSPRSDAAASSAVDPTGRTAVVGSYTPWSKNIPRANLRPKTRVAWNVAFRQMLLARSGAYSLTDYANQMAALVGRTETVFRSFTEKWIKRKRISNPNAVTSEVMSILEALDSLAYTAPEDAPPRMTEPLGTAAEDTLGTLLSGVLDNLVGRLSQRETARAAATFAGSLHGKACEHYRSHIWRTMSSPPLRELENLSDRLLDVSSILHEIAHNERADAIQRITTAARKAGVSDGVRAAARHCRRLAERRFEERLRKVETVFAGRSWQVRCVSRPIMEYDSPYWPAREVAILVDVEDLMKQWFPSVEALLSLGRDELGNDWPFRMVPVMNNQVLASLAVRPSSHAPLPDADFAGEWTDFVGQPMHSSVLLEKFEAAAVACSEISAIVKCRGTRDLHPEEEEVSLRATATFESEYRAIADAAKQTEAEHVELALAYLERNWRRLVEEVEALKAGKPVDDPLCMAAYLALAGTQNEELMEAAAVRLTILQADCTSGVPNSVWE